MQLPSLIFLDGGDPEETRQADILLKQAGLLGIQGQTTNPTLIMQKAKIKMQNGEKLSVKEALEFYKSTVQEMAKVTNGPISIQVFADLDTKKDEMLRQARVYKDWVPNGVIKFPCTFAGLEAAEEFCQEGSVNMTLNFSQEQAAAVYLATRNARFRVFISPFVGRLDDRGENGMEVVKNILLMYQNVPKKVEVLTASVRRLEHIYYALQLGSHAVTIPFKLIQEWAVLGFAVPPDFNYDAGALLKSILFREIPLDRDWRSYDLRHDLTDSGVNKFMEDWKSITK